MLGHSALGTRALCSLPSASMAEVIATLRFELEAPFDHPLADTIGDESAMLVWVAEIEGTEIGSGLGTQTIYAGTLPFITLNSDTPANQPVDGTLDGGIVINRSVVGQDGWTGYSQSVSEVVANNGEGAYDAFGDAYSINGRTITVKVGRIVTPPDGVAPYAQFEPVARLVGERIRLSRAQMIAETRDLQSRLDVPVQTSIYIGNGELEGGAEIKGQRKPRLFGRQDATAGKGGNITPTLVIGSEGLFQVNDGPVDEIIAVRDGGIALTFVADYATVPILRAAVAAGTIAPGQWGSCNAAGFFAIGGVAFKQITADVVGLTLTTADIIEEVALSAGGLTAADLDAWTFEKLNDDQGAEIGYYLDSQSNETCNEMFAKLMAGIGGYHAVTPLGKLQVRRIEAPVGIASEYYLLGAGKLVDVDRADLPRGLDPPPRRQRVAFGRNFTQQTELFGQVSEGDPDFANVLAQPYGLAATPDLSAEEVLADYPFAPDPAPVESYFANEADARTEAERRHALYTSGLKTFRIRLANRFAMHEIGEEIAIKDGGIEPRLGLSGWRYVRFVQIDDDAKTGFTDAIVLG